ncbi:hypothetical protein IGI04_040811 [Brassica rapa subsp. trilocularis]|uniref:Uncharacterized protein n=1 Tax=Brassica rapa subsp. trilocularis TaxID=1813537 RepID=A0ABQ7KNY5_BRACM|nr:hypothetical protein IGI04_040811 [Brassica rapa subsp. trilocularis]
MDGDFLLFSYDGYRTFFLVSIFRDGLPVKPKAPVNIQEISDEDETAGDDDDDDDEEDNDQNMIISLSSGSSEEDNVDALTKLMEVQGGLRLRKGNVLKLLVIQRCILMIPLTLSLSQLRRVAQIIKDHDLKFGGTIKFIDGFGELEGKIGNWKDSIRLVLFTAADAASASQN